jgi:hypothetical protein
MDPELRGRVVEGAQLIAGRMREQKNSRQCSVLSLVNDGYYRLLIPAAYVDQCRVLTSVPVVW